MSTPRRLLKIGGLLALTGGLAWKTLVNSACWRTPWTEISGNPLLRDLLIPSVFYIRSVSLLDAGLEGVIKARGVKVPARYLNRGRLVLNGRIRFLSDQDVIVNGAALHVIRERRNDLAHDLHADVDWNGFDIDAAEIERTLHELGRDEAAKVAEFRRIAEYLQHPAHRKFYLGATGMATAATIDALTILYLERQITRAAVGRGRETEGD